MFKHCTSILSLVILSACGTHVSEPYPYPSVNPAGGGATKPATSTAAPSSAPVPSKAAISGCLAWRETASCAATGERRPCSDAQCSSIVENDRSGYCDCGDKHVQLDCGHTATTCAAACGKTFTSSQCISWRQTGQSKGDGPREPQNDKPCKAWIIAGYSGFCECTTGEVPFDSAHPPFTCDAVCAGEPLDQVVCASGGGNSGGTKKSGCSSNSECGHCKRCELSTGRCLTRPSC